MNAKKKESSDAETPASSRSAPIGRGTRWIVASALIVIVTGGACYAVWQQVREHVLGRDEYQVDPQQITVSRQPEWIHSDVRAEVVRDASFDGPLSLLDPQLTVRIASAFAAHPWVAHVHRVSKKYPSGVEVLLEYRQPAAMVEVNGGALPVDGDGVLLPTTDFSTEDAERYPRISAIHTSPVGTVGTRWGDAAVSGGAEIAAALAGHWHALELQRIEPAGRKPGRTGSEYVFTLFTRGGTRIDWGRAPSTELPGEIPLGDKIAQLKQFAAQNGSLDGPGGPQHLAFLDSGELAVKPRPTIHPLPKKGQ